MMNWAFLGYGNIAQQFHQSLREFTDQKVHVIASRSNAIDLRVDHPDVIVYDDYEDLYSDSSIDIVYISTTHNFHFEQVIQCLEHGKHVLCEKPMGVSYDQVKQMVETAQRTQRYLLEGLWTQYLPAYREVIRLIKTGLIGDLKFVRSDFSVNFPFSAESRLYNPKLSGGSMFDLGVYNVALVNDLYDRLPTRITVNGEYTETGVDAYIGAGLSYDGGQSAQIYCGLNATTQWEAMVVGTKGWIKMEEFFQCQKFTYQLDGERSQTIELPFRSTGFYHEIASTIDHIAAGEIQSDVFSHQKSLDSARLVELLLKELNQSL